MEKYLKPKPLVITERYKFHKRNQKDGETVALYLAELKRLGERCKFGEFLEDALHDRLVCGLRSKAIQRNTGLIIHYIIEKYYITHITQIHHSSHCLFIFEIQVDIF